MRDYMVNRTAQIQKENAAKGAKVVAVVDIEKWWEASKTVCLKFYDTIGKDFIDELINIE